MAADTEIKMADENFVKIQESAGRDIWSVDSTNCKIVRIHKFDTDIDDPPLVNVGGNWVTGSHFILQNRLPGFLLGNSSTLNQV